MAIGDRLNGVSEYTVLCLRVLSVGGFGQEGTSERVSVVFMS